MTLLEIKAIAEVERPHPGDHASLRADVLRFTGSLIAGPAAADNGNGSLAPSIDSRTVSPVGRMDVGKQRPATAVTIVTKGYDRELAGAVEMNVAPA